MLELVKIILVLSAFQSTQSAYLTCFRGSESNMERVPLANATQLIANKFIDVHNKSILYVFGFISNVTQPASTNVTHTFLNIRDTNEWNICLLDWAKEAAMGFLEPVPVAAYAIRGLQNAYTVGEELGEALADLAEAGLDLMKMRLMGYSMGAHLIGIAGSTTKKRGHEVGRIIGCDPCNFLYQQPLHLGTTLNDTTGKLVMVIHTNAHGFGASERLGHVDIWVNFGPEERMVQPGCVCPENTDKKEETENSCSHDVSWEMMLESVMRENCDPFIGTAAPDYQTWRKNKGCGKPTIVVGMETDFTARGNYFLSTNTHKPYGRGKCGVKPIHHPQATTSPSVMSLLV